MKKIIIAIALIYIVVIVIGVIFRLTEAKSTIVHHYAGNIFEIKNCTKNTLYINGKQLNQDETKLFVSPYPNKCE